MNLTNNNGGIIFGYWNTIVVVQYLLNSNGDNGDIVVGSYQVILIIFCWASGYNNG